VKIAYPGESDEYRLARNRLLEQELALRRMMEAVAEARRALPPGGLVPEDYAFDGAGPDGHATKVRMSELFAPGRDTLILYSFMFPRHPQDERPKAAHGETARLPLVENPCPSCTALLDQLDGAAEHAGRHINLVVVAKTSLPRLLTFGRERGWRHLRLLSSAANAYNRDYHGETENGDQLPSLNVFVRRNGKIHHFFHSELLFAPAERGQDGRHVDMIWPLWNLFDVTPEGRGTGWYPRLRY